MFQSGVKYAKTLLPETLVRSVSAVQVAVARRLPSSARPRRFVVCGRVRRRRRELTAASLQQLQEQVARVFALSDRPTLVLEEDGTVVDSEDFFWSLAQDTTLMVLEEGDAWTPDRIYQSFRQTKRAGIAHLTFALYKLQPSDFLCCVGVEASLFEVHSLSHDFRYTRITDVLKSGLYCLTCVSRLTGRLLLDTSTSLLQLTVE